jgi:uncharacterized protein (TIGR00369 family)
MTDPVARREALEAVLEREIAGPPFHAWLRPRAVSVDPERKEILIALDFRTEFSHTAGSVLFHGGILAAFADITGHAAVAVWNGAQSPTITLSIDYIAPASGPTLLARGILRKFGRSIGRADIEISSGEKLVALARGAFSTKKG